MSYLGRIERVLKKVVPLHSRYTIACNYATKEITDDTTVYNEDEDGKLATSEVLFDVIDTEERERQIERMRNKSRMTKWHRNTLFSQANVDSPFDRTLATSRKEFGKYGSASGVDPRLCFATPEEKADRAEYERVAFPFTVKEMIEQNREAKDTKERTMQQRQEKIAQNLSKLDKWIADMQARVAKKEEDAQLAKQRREQFMEEIRQEIGFKIERKDPRFQALMEKKEAEHKKTKKSDKQKAQKAKQEEKLKMQYQQSLQQSKGEEKDGDDAENEKKSSQKKVDGDDEDDEQKSSRPKKKSKWNVWTYCKEKIGNVDEK